MNEDFDRTILLEQCELRCPRCCKNWKTSLGVEFCNCLECGMELRPEKHLVVEKEEEVN